ncbi:chromosome segregation protein SMC [Limosilactobacillus reuteri]|uniref:chromosome segregation protein SMC n=1 Tax=Limosilactobacillus reuteri TaxID=1598 RepID=UPI000B97EE8D|nr:chromosome segregation protein SMC [Limosilactobacillus reuteri]OYS46103.1 chromosome segregation protein SMC [Limosilactobacillus reuteri]OYS47890.1 chromosome segregation protein SMC [Limosilactobacillus reuteri]OYS54251.1 chromosome segregation protein SMC [Limosilactobacillus reuteri]OYS55755.1 chromosome segregation protein SMC [Limosilactobacillus reuteri]OYS64221.1 chromosome segregation protein SMC [Limosilactobacillus reuteri]
MQLLSLTLDGFKSFAQKTTIKFEPGMTGIVGPNGSGKSNIIEAIQWVMGEQSAHHLRGDRMADVIFNGSSDRKPLNRALVSITLDNSDHYLASEFTELTITRKIYRNGDSEYLINDQNVRLKDITDLFIDSGLGRESFSIISQGRIEEIFNGKPIDRRGIIETVAGVAKYKKNKETAEKRLTTTMENLNRVNDIISELEKQIEPLEEQSAIAQDYLEQKKQFDVLDRTQTVRHYDEYYEKLTKLSTKLDQAGAMVKDYQGQAGHDQQQLDNLKQKRQQLNATKDRLQAIILNQTEAIAKYENQQSVSSVRREQRENEQRRLTAQQAELNARLKEVKTSQQANDQQLTKQKALINSQQAEFEAARKMSSGERIAALKQQVEDLRNQQVSLMQERTTIHNQQSFLSRNHEQAMSLQRQNVEELDATKNQLVEINQEFNRYQQEAANTKKDLQTVSEKLNAAQDHREKLNYEYQTKQRDWYEALGDVRSLKSRINAYQAMADEYSGYYRGVQEVLRQRQQFPGLAGAVSELFDVPAKYTQAVETVLGSQLQQLVVDRQATAKAIINFLIKTRAGRVTILPLDTLSHRRPLNIWSQLTGLPGFLGRATELIKFDQKFQIIADHLLGTTVIADNLDHATEIARVGRHMVRVVTLDGQLINASGAMTGGATRSQRTGLLSQKQMAKQLEEELKKQEQLAANLEQEIAKLQQAQKANEQVVADYQQQVQALQDKFHEQESNCQLISSKRETLINRVQILETQNKQQDTQHQDYESQVQQNNEQADKVNWELTQIVAKIKQILTQIDELQNDESTQARQLAQMQQKIAVAEERLQQYQRQSQEYNRQRREVEESLEKVTIAIAELTTQSASQSTSEQSTQTALKDAKEEQAKAKVQLEDNSAALEELEQKLSQAEAHYNRLQELQRAALDDRNTLNEERVKYESMVDQALNRLSEQYSMTIDEARQQMSELDKETLATRLKLLKRGLDDLGQVNVGAIEEYERVRERYDFLKGQQDDLLASRAQLNQTMGEMDAQVKKRFITTFNQVSQMFDETFRQIFSGGHAKLVLTDPHDLLTTGVDIMAQPPGKKNQHLSLLSGGERALTAITLLFAILKVRPVPFAILDEPEAALDEVNVQRFAHYLSKFGAEGPQFIVITHRKGTMMDADVLYGVTMQESGVSKMVSVDVVDTLQESDN